MLRVLDLYYKVAIFELELRKSASRTRLVLQSCDFRAGAAEVYCKVAIFELELRKCTSRLTLQNYDFRAGAAEVYLAY